MSTTKLDVQINETDLRLLQFKTYDEYLDSLVTPKDLFYLESATTAREIARFGCLSAVKTYDEAAFYSRQYAVKNLLYPKHEISILASESTKPMNDLQRELSSRERPNIVRTLSTIIFVSQSDKRGYTISGYVDFAHRLATEDWIPFFRGKQKLTARKNDLSHYNDYTGKSTINESSNYKPFIDKKNRLVFQNLHDGKFLRLDPFKSDAVDVKKVEIKAKGYDLVILFDYVPRAKLQFY